MCILIVNMSDLSHKLDRFQAITGLQDMYFSRKILSAHGWDLEQAVASFNSTSTSESEKRNPPTTSATTASTEIDGRSVVINVGGTGLLGLVWKLVMLPISITWASIGLVTGSIGLGFWVAGRLLSFFLSLIGLNRKSSRIPSVSVSAEAIDFVSDFESQYGTRHPNFVRGEDFTEALQRSRRESKLLFVYLHSPDDGDTPSFCRETLCSEVISALLNENFVVWGNSIRADEGFEMSKRLKVTRFPFCAVIMAAANQSICVLRQFEGHVSPEEMHRELQRVVEQSPPGFVGGRHERVEEDVASQAVEDENQVEREAEKAMWLGPEPEEGADVTQVLVRLPNGERKGRRFHRTATLQSVYDFVDSSGCLEVGSYTLVTFYPRVLYGQHQLSSTLEQLQLYPQASLFVELNT